MQKRMFLRAASSTALAIAMTAGIGAGVATSAIASERGNKDEAVAMVKRAAAHIKAVGKDKAYADFTGKATGFSDRDLYVIVYDQAGKSLAHGANQNMVGKSLIEFKDADGKEVMKEIVQVAFKGPGKGWVDYKWPNPVTKQLEAKSTYVEKVEDVVIGVGIYKTN